MRISLIFIVFLACCGEVWNDPYPASERGRSILYSSFAERPKHLDPVQSYTEDEARFTQQVYEPLLQYHYLKRPYELVPLTAVEVPRPRSIEGGNSRFRNRIRPGIRYNASGFCCRKPRAGKQSNSKAPLRPSPQGVLTADDYLYQIKRLARKLHSPIYGLMAEYIVGLPK